METSKLCLSRGRARSLALCVTVFVMVMWQLAPVAADDMPACPPFPGAVCTCRDISTGFTVECNNRNISVVPSYIPEKTTVLNLARNKIPRIMKGDFLRLESLRTLYLQENQIMFIQPGALDNLYNLELLVLYNNRLSYIPDNWFQHLPAIGSIDLSSNLIVSIDKRAFLTLPASSNSGKTVTIRLSSNPLSCGCDARAMRDWKGSLDRNLARIKFEGFNCRNAQNQELDSMAENLFGQCTAAQLSMFESNQACVSCRGALTHHQCDVSGNTSCSGSKPMCQSNIRIVNRAFSISKQCGVSYADCLLRERYNHGTCNISHSGPVNAMQCTFCCVGHSCNNGGMGGRTNSFKLYVGLRFNRAFQPYMLNPSSSSYIQESGIYKQELSSIFSSASGGYSVTFLSFRNESPNTYVSTLVHTTNLNTLSVQGVVNLMTEKLNVSAKSGFLRRQGIIYIYVGTELNTARKCMMEVTQTDVGPITWLETAAGSTVNVSCPSKRGAFATRQCSGNPDNGVAQWAAPNLNACKAPSSDTTLRLQELKNTDITPNNLNSVVDQLSSLSRDGSRLSAADVTLTMDTVDKVLNTTFALTNSAALGTTVDVLSNLVDAEPAVLAEANRMGKSASRLLDAADRISEEGQLSGGQLMLSGENLVVAAQEVRTGSFQGLTLTADATNEGAFEMGDVTVKSNSATPSDDASSLVLPASLMTSAPGSRVAMTVHQNDKIFQAIRQSEGTTGGTVASDGSEDRKFVTKVNSHVMAASVVGHDVINLQDPVIFTLVHHNENSTNPRCVFWDDEAFDWSSRGCSKVDSLSNENVTTCQCDHLTNFALLMDVFNEGESLSETDSKILSIISYIGCGISLLALLLTLLTYCLFNPMSSRRGTNESGTDQSHHR